MPCFDPRSAEEDRKAQEFMTRFGPLMCEAVGLLREAGALEKASAELRGWAAEHEREDAARATDARARVLALVTAAPGKLTTDELIGAIADHDTVKRMIDHGELVVTSDRTLTVR